MKRIMLPLFVTVLSLGTATAQETPGFNKWSIDINGGISKPTTPLTTGYYTKDYNLFHADLGVRYMFNNKFGLKVDVGYDQFENASKSASFDGKYYRTDIQGVVNLGRVLNFEEWTQRLNVQAHTGIGYAFMTNDRFEGTDNMLNHIIGLTGQVKLSERIALNADFSMINNVRQSNTFDGGIAPEDRGFNGTLYNATIGLSIYLGKNAKHADWYYEESKVDKLAELEKRVGDLETMMNDSDKDGVPDYLDAEPNSIPGVAVDTKGRTIDRNNNGIPDELESYLEKNYGGSGNSGAGLSNETIKDMINQGYVNVYFDFNSTQPSSNSVSGLDFLAKFLKANPSAKAEVIGYADEIGNTDYNKDLSHRRAQTVKTILAKSGIEASRMTIVGNGEDNSVAKDSKVARQMVRRVTFRVK
ncbi:MULTISPECIES: OmpA family protein [Flavobacterium]|uniref:OmpA family protein n=1 Tax=Flavobacterium TaxID=237 RepID=UPI00095F3499|nr:MULTISPECIES: OmpA family protein [Flavobacterium]MBN9284509.1 OmpA family protein [Flavobacterium sp.]OJV72804.1 MAG: flagellar motor protein MotB [Flavobacterium sp. 40-81]